jgi:hypothetical protein
MYCKKFSEQGQYLPFPGFTVVTDTFSNNAEVFESFHQRLSESPAITNYHALLPPESYHITAFSIMEQKKNTPEQWVSWIQSHLEKLQKLHRDLEHNTKPHTFRIVKAKDKQLTLLVEIDTAEAEVEKNLAFADAEMASRLPNGHHISLGYQFKKFENKAAERLCWSEFQRTFQEVFPHYETETYQAMQPKLCYFDDMTKFIPWDATSIPPFTSVIEPEAPPDVDTGKREADKGAAELAKMPHELAEAVSA